MSGFTEVTLLPSDTTVAFQNENIPCTIAISCMVCGESVDLSNYEQARLEAGLPVGPKICDKCKEAILEMRRRIEC